MQVSAELSLYPLDADYKSIITSFIHRLREQPGIKLRTNQLSTQLTGEYGSVMDALRLALEPTFAGAVGMSVVIKLLNVSIDPNDTREAV